jgi:phosphoribosylformylglycinamidine synthase subunit PurL
VGKLPDPAAAPRLGFAEEGHAVAVVGPFAPALEGSELEKLRGGLAAGLPRIDLGAQADALVRLRLAVRERGLATVHDISEGGLACALAECCVAGALGARISEVDGEADLFGEGPGGVVMAGSRDAVEAVEGARVIGIVGGDTLEIAGVLSTPVSRLREVYEGAIRAAVAA